MIKNARYLARNLVGSFVWSYPALSFFSNFSDRIVRREMEICIEGFARSGNTYLVAAFALANPMTRVAHHLHVPQQIVRGVKLGIPVVVVLRSPVESIASLLAVDQRLSAEVAIWSYRNFYRVALQHRQSIFLVSFEDLIRDVDGAIGRINERFNARFLTPRQARISEQAIRNRVVEMNAEAGKPELLIGIPTPERALLKDGLRSRLASLGSMKQAEKVFDACRKQCD